MEIDDLPKQCPAFTPFAFNPDETPEDVKPVVVALGYRSLEAKASFYAEMAGEEIDGCFQV